MRRVRRLETNDKVRYIFTEKRNITDLANMEQEKELTEQEYKSLLEEADPMRKSLYKTRYRIPFAGHVCEVDVYPFWKKQAILEIELENADEAIEFPDWLTV